MLVKQSLSACAIELDDRSHDLPERRARDRLLDRICERAGLPLIRFRVVRDYSRDEIREAVFAGVGQGTASVPSPCSERKLCASIAPGDGVARIGPRQSGHGGFTKQETGGLLARIMREE